MAANVYGFGIKAVFEYAKRDLHSADNIGRKENGVIFYMGTSFLNVVL